MAGCAGGDRIYADYRTSGDYQTSAAGAVAAGNQSGSGFKGVCLSGCTGDDAIMGDYNWIPLDFNWSVTTMNWNLAIAITPRERHRLQVFRGFSLIGGTHPTMRDDKLFNTAYLFTPNGEVHTQDKIHRTRWEK